MPLSPIPNPSHTCHCGRLAHRRRLGLWACDLCLAIEDGLSTIRRLPSALDNPAAIVAAGIRAGLAHRRIERHPPKSIAQILRERRALLRASGITSHGTPYKTPVAPVPVPEYLRESWTHGHEPEIRAGLKAAHDAGVRAGLRRAGLTSRGTPRRHLSPDAEVQRLKDAAWHRRRTARLNAQGLSATGRPLKKPALNLRIRRLPRAAYKQVLCLLNHLETQKQTP